MEKFEMTKERAVGYIAAKGAPITKPGVYQTHVTSCNPYRRVYAGGATQVAIVNVSLTTEFYDERAKTLFRQGKFQEATNQGLTVSILEGQYVPSPGEIVDVTVALIKLRAKDGQPERMALMAQRLKATPPIIVAEVTAEAWLADVEGVVAEEPSMVGEQTEILIPAGVGE